MSGHDHPGAHIFAEEHDEPGEDVDPPGMEVDLWLVEEDQGVLGQETVAGEELEYCEDLGARCEIGCAHAAASAVDVIQSVHRNLKFAFDDRMEDIIEPLGVGSALHLVYDADVAARHNLVREGIAVSAGLVHADSRICIIEHERCIVVDD